MSKHLTQEDRNQTSAATFAKEIRAILPKYVNPETGERTLVPIEPSLSKTHTILYDGSYDVNKFGEGVTPAKIVHKKSYAPLRNNFVSDPRLFNQSLHNPGKAPGFRFVINGEPALTNAGISKFFYPKPKKGGKKKSHKKTGRKTGRKTYKRRH